MTMQSGPYSGTIDVTLNVGSVAASALGKAKDPNAKTSKDPDGSKTLKTLASTVTGITSLVRYSQIASTYQKAMGKVFGAAIDLLLLPFTPIFNVLLVLMNRFIVWLITSGLLESIWKASSTIADYIIRLFDWFASWKEKSWSEIGQEAWNGTWKTLQDLYNWWKNASWTERLGGVIAAVIGATLVNKLLLGIPQGPFC